MASRRFWTVRTCALTLDRRDGKPYAFRAAQTYKLDGPSLVITLEIENAGREALPFGLGVHPFFVRDADTGAVGCGRRSMARRR